MKNDAAWSYYVERDFELYIHRGYPYLHDKAEPMPPEDQLTRCWHKITDLFYDKEKERQRALHTPEMRRADLQDACVMIVAGVVLCEVIPAVEAAEAAAAARGALSVERITQAGETYYHYGYMEEAESFQRGLRMRGFATTDPNLSGTGAQSVLNLKNVRNAVYPVKPQPGTPIIGPRPVLGGTGCEVQFPLGTGPGTVCPPTPIPPLPG
jgi:hypothetical protein